MRLGKLQKALLAWTSGTNVEGSFPCYTGGKLPSELLGSFNYQEDLDRWVKQQIRKGIVQSTGAGGRFLRITDLGQSLIDKQPTSHGAGVSNG
ncbi:hypothetical protein [Stenotrophomonas sp. PS02298]|uniref:hypothetical protein n=1 Tax=Stenotrophomonas sp. PS02298 TaxID=2991424 RepID=UPI00249CE051|nr:hypothetical protein [Stenotrophomonas sp. PS02298]